MQKNLLPSFMEAFSGAQFIVATHNPFIVSCSPDSSVYALNYNANLKVQSERLDLVNRAGTSNELLRDVLGVAHTFPDWVADKVDETVAELERVDVDEKSLNDLRRSMSKLGLEHLFPDVLARVLKRHD